MGGALQGIRVVDFGQYLAGPLLAVMLADHGADVIRVDPPGGPRWKHPANAMLQRGKRSIVLNLKSASGRSTAERLAATADIVVENFRPGVMDRLGVGASAMLDRWPRLIYCSLPGFGKDDPRAGMRGWEGVVCAAAGVYHPSVRHPPDESPAFNAIPFASSYAAAIASHTVMAALIARQRDGLGQRIEVPLFDALFELQGHYGQKLPGSSRPMPRPGAGNFAPVGHFLCADGRWVHLGQVQEHHYRWFTQKFMPAEALARGLGDSARLRTDPALNVEALRVLAEIFKARTASEWELAINHETGACTGVCQTTEEWLHSDEHARECRAVISLVDPEYGPTYQAGYPVWLSRTPPEAQGPRHALDADRAEIVAELESPRAALDAPRASDTRPVLAGYRAIDVSQVLAGPTATRVLAEYGMDVIKVNSPLDNQLGLHLHTNGGKRSMLLDLKTSEGKEILHRLAATVDVFHQNFTRGVAERLGCGEPEIRRIRPDVVYSTISAFGQAGFRSGWRGREELGQAVTGAQLRWGGDEEPLMQVYALNDFGTGHYSAFGILVGLYHRLQTGDGQQVHASLAQTCTYMQIPFMVGHEGRLWDEPRGQHVKGWGPLDRLYQASDRCFYVAAQSASELKNVEGLRGVEGLGGPALEAELTSRFLQQPATTWVKRLVAAGVAASINFEFSAEVMEDPDVKRRGLSLVRQHAEVGEVRSIAPSRRLSRTPARPSFAAPPAGWDTRELVEEAGLGDEFQQLLSRGVLAERQPEGISPVGQLVAVPTTR
ncbi:MAG: CoA transferase [Chloroflexi bacterium]|nr:CoA transferase [Chloroflexota bacterium]